VSSEQYCHTCDRVVVPSLLSWSPAVQAVLVSMRITAKRCEPSMFRSCTQMLPSSKRIIQHHSRTVPGSATHARSSNTMHRRIVLGAAAAFSAATLGARGHATAEGSQAPASQQSLSGQISLDRRNAQLRLVQVVFRYIRLPVTIIQVL
jgi:hypothetical protein